MAGLKYFCTTNIPITITAGVKERVPINVISLIFNVAFQNAAVIRSVKQNVDYFQVINVEYVDEPDNKGYSIKIMQENPFFEMEYFFEDEEGIEFNGKLYLIESWNGKTENFTPDDHYITLLFPEEY
ncbi:MAG: hypothetical protein IKY94_05180 [Lachnospiraceae bacterium]|nr:hypothetical protein [Lachnospiraceae bacterium]